MKCFRAERGLNPLHPSLRCLTFCLSTRQFNITCEDNRWKLTIVGSLNNLGQLMGTPLSGAFSDR